MGRYDPTFQRPAIGERLLSDADSILTVEIQRDVRLLYSVNDQIAVRR
jgi:hypothetical protein